MPDGPTPRLNDATRHLSSAEYHLSAEQTEAFDRDGYVILRSRITGSLLEELQQAADRWIGLEGQLPDSDLRKSDYEFVDGPAGRIMYRVNYLHDKGEPASLTLLGSPELLGIAESLAGPDLLPTYESMVFKSAGQGARIVWHQDAIHDRSSRIFNVDIYLDASIRGQGALRVVPGSQRAKGDATLLSGWSDWDVPDSVDVEMGPGDVLVHDVMLLHGSEATTGDAPLRRTLYYEFRPAQQVLRHGPWDSTWVDRRLQLLQAALLHHRQARPAARQFAWNLAPAMCPSSDPRANVELRITHDLST